MRKKKIERYTVVVDETSYKIAIEYANSKGCSISYAISDLIRLGIKKQTMDEKLLRQIYNEAQKIGISTMENAPQKITD